MADDKGITPHSEDSSQWYIDIVRKAELADYSPVKGCMVIRPNGYALWENMQKVLDGMFKATGHKNAYFPLFIPKSFLSKEAAHVEGFAKECAVITHYRLKNDPDGGGVIVDPEAKLEEELIVRPTSETIIWYMYRQWIQSYRDLPLLLNQWANVVRWEMRTRLFLRTTEFLWQEGHTAHATSEDAEVETMKMLNVYKKFAEEYMAVPVVPGIKPEAEKFAGALHTYTIEALMKDGKALQAGTSHHLGQNFAKAFDVTFLTEKGTREFVWATSWGVSTRLIGALIMVHSDDRGLVLPPRLAPTQLVVVPIYKKPEERAALLARLESLRESWKGFTFEIDDRQNLSPGFKFHDHELKGIPLRMEIGPRDLASDQAVLARRDKEKGEEGQKVILPLSAVAERVPQLLEEIQANLFERARVRRDAATYTVDTWEELKQGLEERPGFYRVFWAEDPEGITRLANETNATVRCFPFNESGEEGRCIASGKPTRRIALIAKAY